MFIVTDFYSTLTLKAVLKASRPASWCFGPILFLIGLIHSEVRPSTYIEGLKILLQLASLSLPLSTIVFGVNDVYDYASDIRNPRKISNGLEGTIPNPSTHPAILLAARLSSVLIILVSLGTLDVSIFLTTATLVILAWQYSSPPFRIKEAPIFDSLSNGVIVLLCYVLGYITCNGAPNPTDSISRKASNSLSIPPKGLMLALCTSAIHALGAAADVEADVAAGQRTIATVTLPFLGYPPKGALLFGTLCYAVALATLDSFNSVFGVYIHGGFLIFTSALLFPRPFWIHVSFRGVVWWSLGMVFVWLGTKVAGVCRSSSEENLILAPILLRLGDMNHGFVV